jgi:hypothetical protein
MLVNDVGIRCIVLQKYFFGKALAYIIASEFQCTKSTGFYLFAVAQFKAQKILLKIFTLCGMSSPRGAREAEQDRKKHFHLNILP